MRTLKLIILLFVLTVQASAQDMLHLCPGPNHNFGVPYTIGSSYNWQVQMDTAIATITSIITYIMSKSSNLAPPGAPRRRSENLLD